MATPRATRTPWPTRTPQPTYTPTTTPEPVVVEAQSLSLNLSSAGRVSVVLHTPELSVAGLQNDLSFSADAAIVGSNGKPLCTVNPTINKSSSTFTFLPNGCGAEAAPCTKVRAIILSFDNVNPIPDGSEVYNCVMRSGAQAGTFTIGVDRVGASDARGVSLPSIGISGVVSVLATGEATATATQVIAAPTQSPVHRPDGGPSAASDGSGSASASGCSLVSENHDAPAWLLLAVIPWLRRRPRRALPRTRSGLH
ncbi:MAG: hypothetical protein HY270_24145 [Deltaproteobacteria bacterium]|nr:hypothetical protein [Deltaproteobacteria bacterium]